MLYNPKWQFKPETKELSFAGLIDWLETQDPDGCYDLMDLYGDCPIDRYVMSVRGWITRGCEYAEARQAIFGDSSLILVITERPHTFGAALERARRLRISVVRNGIETFR